jgi:hypothetical protein
MSFLAKKKALHLAALGLSAATALSLAAPANAAVANYGPPQPPPNQPPPGGFNCILTSRTIKPWGGRIGPLRDGALRITITIPQYTFPVPVQLTITEPYSRFRPCQGVPLTRLRGFRLFGGIGIEVTLANSPYGLFPHPIRLRISAINVARFEAEEVAVVGRNGHVRIIAGRRHEGSISITARTSEVLAVFVETRKPRRPGRPGSRPGGAGETERLTAALRPGGAWLPGLGVLSTADSGVLLSAGAAQSRPSR